jgi:hypothetical protein
VFLPAVFCRLGPRWIGARREQCAWPGLWAA